MTQSTDITNITPVPTPTGEGADYTTAVPVLHTVEQQLRDQQLAPQFAPANQQFYQAQPPAPPVAPQPVPQEQQTGAVPPWMQPQQPAPTPVPQQVPVPPPSPQTPPQQQQTTQQFDPQQLNQIVQAAFGVTPDEFRAGIEYIRQQQSQQVIEQGRQQVLSLWQVDQVEAERRLGHVREYFQRLPPEQQQAYNVIGIAAVPTLWNDIVRQYPTIANAQPVPMDRSQYGGNVTTGGYMFTRSQLNAMTDAQLRQIDRQVLYASQHGLIYEDDV